MAAQLVKSSSPQGLARKEFAPASSLLAGHISASAKHQDGAFVAAASQALENGNAVDAR